MRQILRCLATPRDTACRKLDTVREEIGGISNNCTMSSRTAILLLSFGGPDKQEDVIPFLENVTAGRGVPRDRLEQVATQYQHFGGKSPINDQNRELQAKLQAEVNRRLTPGDEAIKVYWGNRNWDPYVADAFKQMVDDGVERVLVVVTSGYSSYSSCRQYREDLAAAIEQLETEGIEHSLTIDKIRRWSDHPAVVEVLADHVDRALDQLSSEMRTSDKARLIFTTHSIPEYQVVNSRAGSASEDELWGYVEQHELVAQEITRLISERRLGPGERFTGELVYQSRSGPPNQPWLEPDVNDYLAELPGQGVEAVVVTPIGFASDHMEVKWDLDNEAATTAQELGLKFERAATVGSDDRFVTALVDMVYERLNESPMSERPSLAPVGAAPDVCPANCCLGHGDPRPALCGADS